MFGLLFQDGLHNLAGNAIPSKRLRIATWANEPWKTLLHLLPCSLERAGFDVPCCVLILFWMGNIALPNCHTRPNLQQIVVFGVSCLVLTPTKALVCSHLSLAEQPLMSWRWNKCPQPLPANGTYLKTSPKHWRPYPVVAAYSSGVMCENHGGLMAHVKIVGTNHFV